MPVRVGINALYLLPGAVGGTEIYLRSLLAALAEVDPVNEYFIYVNQETGKGLAPATPLFRTVECGVHANFRPARIVYEQTALCHRLRRDGIDVVFNPGYTMPLLAHCPSVTVFHDLQHKKHPEFFRRWDLPFWNLLLSLSARHSDSIIAVSDPTVSDLVEWMPAARDRVHVVPHGTDEHFFALAEGRMQRAAHGRPYILTVSTLHPHKNLERLLPAFAQFRQTDARYGLVIAGLRGFASAQLENLATKLGLSESVTFTGWVPRESLYQLFARAEAFIAPSLFEGFGLTVLEAMAAGLPLACSAIAPFRALTTDCAHHFEPTSVPGITDALRRITEDSDFRLRAAVAGPCRARQFTWRRAAESTLRCLVNAAQRGHRKSTVATAPPHVPT